MPSLELGVLSRYRSHSLYFLLLLQEEFEAELKRRLDEIGRKVADTVKRSEEQSEIIERLQGNVSFNGHLILCATGSRIVRALSIQRNHIKAM